MADRSQALNSFWNGFSLAAYDENYVPEGTAFPYLTYEAGFDDFDLPVSLSASIWYRDYSWRNANEKMEQISGVLSGGGVILPYDGGGIWLTKGTPFAQRMGDESDELIKRYVLNVSAEFIQK